MSRLSQSYQTDGRRRVGERRPQSLASRAAHIVLVREGRWVFATPDASAPAPGRYRASQLSARRS